MHGLLLAADRRDLERLRALLRVGRPPLLDPLPGLPPTLDFTRSNREKQWLQCTASQVALIHFWRQFPPIALRQLWDRQGSEAGSYLRLIDFLYHSNSRLDSNDALLRVGRPPFLEPLPGPYSSLCWS